MQRQELERLNREQLIAEAERIGVPRPRVLTQPELIDEIIARTTDTRDRARARGWLGRARDLLATVVERGLHLPEAARALRSGGSGDKPWPPPPPPLPTVTLAEIYAAQGHLDRAIAVLDEVIAREPDHKEAAALKARFLDQQAKARSRGRGASETTPEPAVVAAKSEPAPANDEGDEGEEATEIDLEGASAPAKAESIPPVAQTLPATGDRNQRASDEIPPAALPPVIESAPVEPVAPQVATRATPPTEAVEVVETEPSLPDRYDVDEIVALAVDPRTLYLYWEVRAKTLARARAKSPSGFLCLRATSVTPSWKGPVSATNDVRVDALSGDRFFQGLVPGSNVRVSIGWSTGAAYEPFAVGVEVTLPRAAPAPAVAQQTTRWQPRPAAARRLGGQASVGPRLGGFSAGPSFTASAQTTTAEVAAPAKPSRLPPRVWTPKGPARLSMHTSPAGSETWSPLAPPADSGVERWDQGAAAGLDEGTWFATGGASEQLPIGGSELSRGGASELGRAG